MDGLLLNIFLIEKIATFRAELGRILRVRRYPAAFVAFIEGRICWLFSTAVCAELALVYRAAGAGPALGSSLGLPQPAQNLPVLPPWPQLQVHPAGAAPAIPWGAP